MKVLHLNTTDITGGAAIAAMRLHKLMLKNGIDSNLFCLNRSIIDDESIFSLDFFSCLKSTFIYSTFTLIFKKLKLTRKLGAFSNMKIGNSFSRSINIEDYDVIYLHWVNNYFISLKGLKQLCKIAKNKNIKLFWFMHDMFPVTGGCHYSFECQNYKKQCGMCPYIKHFKKNDFSYKQLKLKKHILNKYKNISFITPSKWLYNVAKQSSLASNLNVYHIPNVLNNSVYKQIDKTFCRNALNISLDKKVILFGADSALTNPYKGFDYLVDALNIFSKDNSINKDDFLLVIFGSSYNKKIDERLPFKTKFMGYLHDEYTINLLYNSADVFCIPSLAENFPNTVLESIHCKTPVLGFDIGGIPDMVYSSTGYLAKYKDANDFANGLKHILLNNNSFNFDCLSHFEENKLLNMHLQMWKE